ncbi:MAG: DsrE family protein [Candidatus Bathyarchaeota archaeon]
MNLTIIVNDPPYGSEKPWNALRLASTAASEEMAMKVRVFLMGDSVVAAKRGQKTPDGFYNMEKMLQALIHRGVEVKVCGTCITARGLDPSELVEGVEKGSMKILAEWIRDSDRVVSF